MDSLVGLLLATLISVSVSQPFVVRTDEQTIACAAASFFAYEQPLNYQPGSNVWYLNDDPEFVSQTFLGGFQVIVHNITQWAGANTDEDSNVAYVEVSTPLTLFYTAAVPQATTLILESSGVVPRMRDPGTDGNVLTVRLIAEDRKVTGEVNKVFFGSNQSVYDQQIAANVSVPLPADGTTVPVTSQVTMNDGSILALTITFNPTLGPAMADSGYTQWIELINWKALAELFPDPLGMMNMTYVAFVDSNYTNTQLWVARNTATQEVMVAFRGTHEEGPDYATSLNASMVPYRPQDVGLPVTSSTPMMHSGYYKAVQSVITQVTGIINACIGNSTGTWNVTITGHSLGAALATLAAEFVATYEGRKYTLTRMYNYGSPRAGNTAFANSFSVNDSFRHFNSLDDIPTVPPRLEDQFGDYGFSIAADFAHVFPAVNISSEGNFTTYPRGTTELYESTAAFVVQLAFVIANPEDLGGVYAHHTESTYYPMLRNMAYMEIADNKTGTVVNNNGTSSAVVPSPINVGGSSALIGASFLMFVCLASAITLIV